MNSLVTQGDTRQTRFDLWVALLIGLLTLAWLLFISGGRPGLDPDGAGALHTAQNIADGEGMVTKFVDLTGPVTFVLPKISKPPLFTSLIALLILCGIPPKLAGWAITFISFAGATSFLYLLSRRFLTRGRSLLVAGMFATQMTGVRWGINLHEESLFLALSFATLWLYTASIADKQTPLISDAGQLRDNFLVGGLAALAMLASYQGLPLLLVLGGMALWQSMRSHNVKPALGYGLGVALVGFLPLLRFLEIWTSGRRPGFDSVGESTWYAIIAGMVSAWQSDFLGDVRIWLMDGSLSDYAVLVFAFGLLATLALKCWQERRLRLLIIYIGLYIVMVIIQMGGYGKPYYESRYNAPINGLILILLIYALTTHFTKLPNLLRLIGAGIGAIALIAYAYGQINRYHQFVDKRVVEYCPAPESIKWIMQNIPSGAVILGTQCTYQLIAETNDYYWLAIPPARDDHVEKRWTETDLLASAKRAHAEWIVLITGTRKEPFLSDPGYGSFVEGLFEGKGSDRIQLAMRLPDGLIYRIRPQSSKPE